MTTKSAPKLNPHQRAIRFSSIVFSHEHQQRTLCCGFNAHSPDRFRLEASTTLGSHHQKQRLSNGVSSSTKMRTWIKQWTILNGLWTTRPNGNGGRFYCNFSFVQHIVYLHQKRVVGKLSTEFVVEFLGSGQVADAGQGRGSNGFRVSIQCQAQGLGQLMPGFIDVTQFCFEYRLHRAHHPSKIRIVLLAAEFHGTVEGGALVLNPTQRGQPRAR